MTTGPLQYGEAVVFGHSTQRQNTGNKERLIIHGISLIYPVLNNSNNLYLCFECRFFHESGHHHFYILPRLSLLLKIPPPLILLTLSPLRSLRMQEEWSVDFWKAPGPPGLNFTLIGVMAGIDSYAFCHTNQVRDFPSMPFGFSPPFKNGFTEYIVHSVTPNATPLEIASYP